MKGDQLAIDIAVRIGIGQDSNDFKRLILGVKNSKYLWRNEDGSHKDFIQICTQHFELNLNIENLLIRLENAFSKIVAGYRKIQFLNAQSYYEGSQDPIDKMLAELDPFSHFEQDMFSCKLGFVILLNFSSKDIKDYDDRLSSSQFIISRNILDYFLKRIPYSINQDITRKLLEADGIMKTYRVALSQVEDEKGNQFSNTNMVALPHWDLRDYLIKMYSSPSKSVQKQTLLQELFTKINEDQYPEYQPDLRQRWSPFTDQPIKSRVNSKYAALKSVYQSYAETENFYAIEGQFLEKYFQLEKRLNFTECQNLLFKFISHDIHTEISEFILNKLKRPLEPFDIWYPFVLGKEQASSTYLDKKCREQLPNLKALGEFIRKILAKLCFSEDQVKYLSNKIELSTTHMAGHAWQPHELGGHAYLRIPWHPDQISFELFQAFMHELGHVTEMILSNKSQKSLFFNGLPSNAFSEAIAFIFQEKSEHILNDRETSEANQHLKNLDLCWKAREAALVALVEMKVWAWMSEERDFSTDQLRQAVLSISKDIWNNHCGKMFKRYDINLLASYSHMYQYPLVLSDYPLGYFIQSQIEQTLKSNQFGPTLEKLCSTGRLLPQEWLIKNTGNKMSFTFIIENSEASMKVLRN